ncbi:carbohydrate esterase family 4 protein [Rickenella mellea]|uniref:Carbohydrate esterase family 4 protein n=1 Tax=Rickenella mellea TaxID=50990 RepID=A0A4Y7PVE1_9AGAM|nr:carbohydrate esterase family 4 protein [Rickenella mellea]
MTFTASVSKFLVLASCLFLSRAAPAEKDLGKRATLATIYSTCKHANTVALTFDDGPYMFESGIVDTLNNAGIKATFFVNGDNWDCIYDDPLPTYLKKAYNSGHMIGDHTWHHYDLSTLTWDQIHDEMWRVELAMMKILGASPAFMRPPYGSYNDLVRQASAVRNQSMVLWDFDSGDSTGSTVAQSEQAYTNLINQKPSTVIALNHETYQGTAQQVLPFAIQHLKAAGYKFDTIAGCLGMNPYHSFNTPSTRDLDVLNVPRMDLSWT